MTSRADLGHLWFEHMRRQLGRPTMTDDEFERLGHAAVADNQMSFDDTDEETR